MSVVSLKDENELFGVLDVRGSGVVKLPALRKAFKKNRHAIAFVKAHGRGFPGFLVPRLLHDTVRKLGLHKDAGLDLEMFRKFARTVAAKCFLDQQGKEVFGILDGDEGSKLTKENIVESILMSESVVSFLSSAEMQFYELEASFKESKFQILSLLKPQSVRAGMAKYSDSEGISSSSFILEEIDFLCIIGIVSEEHEIFLEESSKPVPQQSLALAETFAEKAWESKFSTLEAMQNLELALSILPNNRVYHLAIGEKLFKLKEYSQASFHMEQALQEYKLWKPALDIFRDCKTLT